MLLAAFKNAPFPPERALDDGGTRPMLELLSATLTWVVCDFFKKNQVLGWFTTYLTYLSNRPAAAMLFSLRNFHLFFHRRVFVCVWAHTTFFLIGKQKPFFCMCTTSHFKALNTDFLVRSIPSFRD
jgi:hypothetical protein